MLVVVQLPSRKMAICLCKLLLMCESMKRSLRLAELTYPCIKLAKHHISLHVSHGVELVATHYSPVQRIDGDILAILPAGACNSLRNTCWDSHTTG